MQVEQQTVLPPSLHSSPTVRQQHHQSTPPHPAPRSISQTPASPPKPSQPIPMQTYPPGPSAVCTPPPSSPVLGAGPSPRNHFRAQTLLTAASISPTARFLCLGDGKGLELMDDFQEGARLTTARGAGAATAQTAAPLQGQTPSVLPAVAIPKAELAGEAGEDPLRRQAQAEEGHSKEE